ncbi:folylpolyglutamate synthase/dihydrofolate synthase family protein [Planomicrobium sp. CPCC 101110]|uniref:bifunctional folylpolyglutamate synthase/dihydrofolate synthase n=1 Tax=Planomicrobium sp. CPCC 101110 TaxID=2599619 RepID=UPI0011B65DF2|nr:Mur ligase family protein [Planomicrobium sp. CPCC 101110]TWT26279.1 bifunctional folylpolyglutamate synthase/dihydrofolate synthase [Planomicrobium sp. CPCC 101110]
MIKGFDNYVDKWKIITNSEIIPGMSAITSALEELGNPHRSGKFVHIAGTNGKGSTAVLLAGILRAHGLAVNSFFSPAINDVHDQIQLDGSPISEKEMDRAMEKLAKIKTPLTEFELLTAAAFLAFEKTPSDITIIETGMGGRYDSTNAITPEVSIIPSIALDHTAFLGGTIEDIAWHKAGIIKKWRPVVIGNLPERAKNLVIETANGLHAEVIEPQKPAEVKLKLKGKHQLHNAALAAEAAKELLGLAYDEAKAEAGLANAVIPNRFEEIYPDVVFDGAHNAASINALVETIKDTYPDQKIHIVLGVLKDKDYIKILRQLEQVSDHFTFLDFNNERALPAETLFEESKSKIKTIQNLYDILPEREKNEVTIVTGSLYLLSSLRNKDIPTFQNFIPHS